MKLLALDGNSLAYRAFFALPEEAMTTSDGQPTNAVVGFVNMLLRMLRERAPDRVCVTWDVRTPQFRLDLDPGYKAQREETPQSLRSQMQLLREVVDAFGIRMLELEGAEADDILATLAREGAEAGMTVEIVSGDRDIFQVVRDRSVTVVYTKRGITDVVEMTPAAVEERYGVSPQAYPELAALRGDTSDNLPGVPGIGDKTAAKLLERYGSLDAIIAHVDELTPKQRENVAAHWDRVMTNIALMRLRDDVELPVGVDELAVGAWDIDRIRQLYATLEFGPAILKRTLEVAARYSPGDAAALAATDDVDVQVARPGDAAAFVVAVRDLASDTEVAVDVDDDTGVWAFATAAGHVVVSDPSVVTLDDVAGLLGGDGPGWIAHGAKRVQERCLRDGFDVDGLVLDTEIAAFVLEPARGSYPLDVLASEFLGVDLVDSSPAPQGELALGDTPGDTVGVADALGRRACTIAALAPVLREKLVRDEMAPLYDDVERPVTRVLAKMEVRGIRIDVDYLGELSAQLAGRIATLQQRIWELAGREFAVNSPKQLAEVLFDDLGLTPIRKTKTGRSTDAATLEALVDEHPIAEAVLEYRNLEKLRSTYTDALPPMVDPADGRIHTRFKQTGAATGRLSSENPNLMNIPIRTEEGRRIRKAFVPADGWRLCAADYSQIELRIMAHLSGDTHMIDAFRAGEDVHTATAAKVFDIDAADVDRALRERAKAVNYGLLYGMQTWGLASRMGISRDEAQEFIDAYFAQFPTIDAFMRATVEQAERDGYTTTILGRRRYFPELRAKNPRLRQMGERQALNAPIQGSAADIIKVAMLRLDEALAAEGLATQLLLQVHDELVCEVPPDEVDRVGELLPQVMGDAVALSVPLDVDVHFGDDWAECK